MAAIRTKYEQTKVYDPPVKSEVNSVQDIFSMEAIEESGIFILPEHRYSKTYKLSDINFAGITDEENDHYKFFQGPERYSLQIFL